MRLAPGPSALLALTLVTAAAGAQGPLVSPPPVRAPAFVRVVAGHFDRNGSVFRFLGANVAVMHGEAHRAALDTTLDAVRSDGLRVIRVWALGEWDAGAPEWARRYAFRIGEDGWVEESFVHLDRVLAAASARDLRVIVVLANRWGDYGGIPQYLRWSGDAFVASETDGIARAELGTFFRSARGQTLYLAHLERVVTRVSTITGVAYRDDPTIFAWELVNEIASERRDAADLAAFVSTAARRLHALDPNHLVSAGHIGYTTAAERRTWREVVSLPEIDYADAHAYPTEHDRVRSLAELDAFVDDHAAYAQTVLRRPLVLGEVGFRAGRRALGRTRAALFDRFLARTERAGVDGALTWIYGPSTDRAGPHTILADHPDRDARRVRATLARHAHELDASVTSPAWPLGPAPLWDPSRTIRGTSRASRAVDGVVAIPPEAFFEARFELVGAYDEGAIAHVYGAGHGHVTYRFRPPPALGSRVRVSVRASSELPGPGLGASPEDGSHVLVSIDGLPIGAIDVPPDDGVGRLVAIELAIDDALGSALRAPGPHALRFEVEDDDRSHGLCFYGAATGHAPLDPAIAAELPGRVEIAFLP